MEEDLASAASGELQHCGGLTEEQSKKLSFDPHCAKAR
jgi:hypothetical protein